MVADENVLNCLKIQTTLIYTTVDWLNIKHVSLIIYGRNNGAGNVKFYILHKPNLVGAFIYGMSFKLKNMTSSVFSHLKVV